MKVRFLSAGDRALVVEFGDRVDRELSKRVLHLDAIIRSNPPAGIVETVPTFRSLAVYYNALVTSRAELQRAIEPLLDPGDNPRAGARLWYVPVCYEGEFAPDLAEVARLTGLTPNDVVALHSGTRFHVGRVDLDRHLADRDLPLREPRRVAFDRRDPDPDVRPGAPQTCAFRARRRRQVSADRSHRIRFDPPGGRDPQLRGRKRAARPMTPGFKVLSPGLHTTVQDLGRIGYQDIGVPVSGALDGFGLRLANALVGNPPGTEALEILVSGPNIETAADTARLALVGAGATLGIRGENARVVTAGQSATVQRGDIVEITLGRQSACCYLALEGGIAVPKVRSGWSLGHSTTTSDRSR